jgi:predicted transcriptional regulator
MAKHGDEYLSRRFQQIMEIVYVKERATAADVEEALPGSPTNSTVRTQLRELEGRGLLRHSVEKGRFYYEPTRPKPSAAVAAMRRFLQTFVDGSLEQAFVTMLSAKETDLTEQDLVRLRQIIDEAQQKGK